MLATHQPHRQMMSDKARILVKPATYGRVGRPAGAASHEGVDFVGFPTTSKNGCQWEFGKKEKWKSGLGDDGAGNCYYFTHIKAQPPAAAPGPVDIYRPPPTAGRSHANKHQAVRR
jgi:hypothetical protein